ncbi:NADAR family protein [Asticcacaulis sp. 201]|uniref:NADAR family protein n=1 Tax=Asticcacaulis sp. 201 TaxID=3028787 RepID=UPI0029162D28|nr:NADAR family protein [Asticcacaulis sp. 201]MDV6330309.1 NADAR family protein [Asticcacaulis sp. 201]
MIEPVYFYTPLESYGDFSNFSRRGIDMDGLWWATVEHYFQAQKFENPQYREKIRRASTAKQAAALGRDRTVPLRPDWEAVKVDIMRKAVLKKFQTHAALTALLRETGNRPIVENAPGDYFWGCGQDGTGENWLGRILEDVRKQLA